MSRHCSKCGKPWRRTWAFCARCGAPAGETMDHVQKDERWQSESPTGTAAGASSAQSAQPPSLAFRLGSEVGRLLGKGDPGASALGGLAGEIIGALLQPKEEAPPSLRVLPGGRDTSRRKRKRLPAKSNESR